MEIEHTRRVYTHTHQRDVVKSGAQLEQPNLKRKCAGGFIMPARSDTTRRGCNQHSREQFLSKTLPAERRHRPGASVKRRQLHRPSASRVSPLHTRRAQTRCPLYTKYSYLVQDCPRRVGIPSPHSSIWSFSAIVPHCFHILTHPPPLLRDSS